MSQFRFSQLSSEELSFLRSFSPSFNPQSFSLQDLNRLDRRLSRSNHPWSDQFRSLFEDLQDQWFNHQRSQSRNSLRLLNL